MFIIWYFKVNKAGFGETRKKQQKPLNPKNPKPNLATSTLGM